MCGLYGVFGTSEEHGTRCEMREMRGKKKQKKEWNMWKWKRRGDMRSIIQTHTVRMARKSGSGVDMDPNSSPHK